MLRRAALVAALVLGLGLATIAAPAAWAQSAGDEQYQDPFAGQGGGSSGGGSSGGGSSGSSGSAAPAAPAPTSTPGPAGATSAAAQAVAAQPSQLPRTGSDAWRLALVGAVLVIAGVGLRLRLRADGEPRR
jgi:hypothetical protein